MPSRVPLYDGQSVDDELNADGEGAVDVLVVGGDAAMQATQLISASRCEVGKAVRIAVLRETWGPRCGHVPRLAFSEVVRGRWAAVSTEDSNKCYFVRGRMPHDTA